MYGVPQDLPLHDFVGVYCNQIAIGQFQMQFHFSGAGSIYAESRWDLRASNGELLDRDMEHAERKCYRVHEIIGQQVARFEIHPPSSFTLVFESGHSLTIYDDSAQYESFCLLLKRGASIFV